MIRKLSNATIYVLDQAKALDVYTQKLGFDVRTDVTMDGFRWLTVGPKGQPDLEFVLFEVVRPVGMFDEAAVGHMRALLERGLMSAGVFEADDCQKTYEELKAKGIEFMSPPQKQPYGIEALFKDGCGNWFSLMQH